jgi:TolB protein
MFKAFLSLSVAVLALAAAALLPALPAMAQTPLRIEITEGVIEPLPFAAPLFQAETAGAEQLAADLTRVVSADLTGTGLFREIPASSFISTVSSFGQPVAFPDWRAINAQALIVGAVAVNGGQLTVKFRLYDVFSGAELGEGLQFAGTPEGWRRMAHKVADAVYSRITGETGYFDSRVVYVAESGPKDNRQRRLAIMDYDGANTQFLTDSASLVLAPRFSPTGDRVSYTSYETGFPRVNLLDVASVGRRELTTAPGEMAFSPRFSRDGASVIYSLSNGGNVDIYRTDLGSGTHSRLTNAPIHRNLALAVARWQPDRVRKRPLGQPATLCDARRRRRADPDLVRRGPLWQPGLVAARRSGRLYQAERGPVPHRRDAHRWQRRAVAHGLFP